MGKTTEDYIEGLDEISKAIGTFDQGEIGWLYSATRHAPTYQDAALKEDIQNRLDHAVSGLSIVYMFALFETHFPKCKWKKHIAPDVLDELLNEKYKESIASKL